MAQSKPARFIEDLRQLADLLMQLLDEPKDTLAEVQKELERLPTRRVNDHKIQGRSSYKRYIADIAVYLKEQDVAMITPYSADKAEKHRTKPGKRLGDRKGQNLLDKPWLSDYLLDLQECVTEPGKTEKGRAILKKEKVYCTFKVYFWHWVRRAKREKELQGKVLEGNLSILGNWTRATFDYQPPDREKISYSGPIELRHETIIGTHSEPENHRTYYLSLSETTDKHRQMDKLMVVLTVLHNHPDNTVLAGTFTSADLAQGYPAMGRIFLIEHKLLEITDDISSEQKQQMESLKSFARTYVAYQTRLIRHSSFATLDEIPGLALWRESESLFRQPLHGYFFKAIQRNDPTNNERGLVHFLLKVDPSPDAEQPSQAIIEYDDPTANKTNKGHLHIEAAESYGGKVFRGEFDFLPEQNRFRFQILFSKAPDSEWYFGVITGQGRNGQNLLWGRFALRKEPLDSKWLVSERIGELLQYDRSLADFMLEVNQHIPTETLPLYQHIGWPHLPRPHHTPEELHFVSELAGDYLCFALIRKNHHSDDYKIAAYPLKIHPDGRSLMKFEKRKKPDGSEYTVEYYGRAFNNTDADRLFIYFDSRKDANGKKTFHLSMYFKVQPSSQISTAFGVSSRYVHTEDMPEARMEVLISLKNINSETVLAKRYNAYREFDPFSEEDCQDLDEIAPNLMFAMAGRLNRLILLSSKLRPNREITNRNDPFRTLHIKAALYEMTNISSSISESIKLLRDSYRHGYGTDRHDARELQEKLDDKLFRMAFSRRKPAYQKTLNEELFKLWGVSINLLEEN